MRRGLLVAITLVLGCSRAERTDAISDAATADGSASAPPAAFEPVRIETVAVPGDLDAFVLRGARAHRLAMVFLPGMCVHPGGYAMAFQHTAAARGDLVALQGDVSCGGGYRRWSNDLEAIDRRIDAAFVAGDLEPPQEMVLVGYSQGAERAEHLAARFPRKYTSVVLIASPIVPSPARLAHSSAAVLMAGTRDNPTKMRAGLAGLQRARIRATFLPLEGASHGQMGIHPEDDMARALDFIESR